LRQNSLFQQYHRFVRLVHCCVCDSWRFCRREEGRLCSNGGVAVRASARPPPRPIRLPLPLPIPQRRIFPTTTPTGFVMLDRRRRGKGGLVGGGWGLALALRQVGTISGGGTAINWTRSIASPRQ